MSEAKGFRPSRDRDHPPLDANFFRRAARHLDNDSRLRRVVQRAEQLGQRDLCGDAPPVSLEQHMGRLYFEMQTSPTDEAVRSYYNVVRLYTAELLKTTNWLIGRKGQLRKMVISELRAGSRVTILTFNHDLLIENALLEMSGPRYGNLWCTVHGHGLGTQEHCFSQNPRFAGTCPGGVAGHIPVLKLHGSVNWVFRTRGQYPPADLTRNQRTLLIWTNKKLPEWTYKLGGGRRDWYLWPLIVPPIYEKHGFIHGDLERVWKRARRALADATKTVFWGYSFPQADLHARYFFQAAAHENDALRRPILINPDPAAHVALSQVLTPRRVTQYHDVVDYLSDSA